MDWTAAGALAALISAAIAALYTYLTYCLVRSQTEPNVVVYVHHDESRTTILQIVIENIGRGLATNVRFTSNRPIPARAFGLSPEKAEEAEEMKEGPLIEGIPALGPGDSRKVDWGQFGGLYKALGDATIEVMCDYDHCGRSMPRSTFILEVRSFKTTCAASSEFLRIIREIEGIRRALENMSSNFRDLIARQEKNENNN